MAGAQGKNYVAQIAISGALTTIACQGDLTLDPQVALQISRTKNCKHPFYTEGGWIANLTVELETPMHATHAAIRTNAAAQSQVNCAVISTDSGVPTYTGNAFVSWSPLTAPTEGIATWNVQIAWVNDPTYAAAT